MKVFKTDDSIVIINTLIVDKSTNKESFVIILITSERDQTKEHLTTLKNNILRNNQALSNTKPNN